MRRTKGWRKPEGTVVVTRGTDWGNPYRMGALVDITACAAAACSWRSPMGETADLLARLQRHYIKPGEPLPGGVFLHEVGWNGQGGYRRCDALYVGFTTTSGRILVGHELKISRADWLHELDQNGKSDEWADECHEWWLVVNDPAIVRDGELPAGWGLMAPGRSKTRMQIVHKPDRKPATHRPGWHALRSILARQDTLRAHAISDVKMSARADAEKNLQARVDLEVGHRMQYQPDVAELERKLKLIETALGGRIDWGADERGYILSGREHVGLAELELIAGAVRAAGTVDAAARHLVAGYLNPIGRTRRAVDDLETALAELSAVAESQQEAHHGA